MIGMLKERKVDVPKSKDEVLSNSMPKKIQVEELIEKSEDEFLSLPTDVILAK